MKNYLKRKPKSAVANDEAPSRITNETVAEHREQVLAGGRKFKYPKQYQKHKLVINSLLIGLAAIILLGIFGWHQLYIAENSSKLMYRVTQLVPVSVASVDGTSVRYSDYLMRYRSSIYYLQKQNTLNLKSEDGKRQAAFIQRQELDKAEMMAYVKKLARDNKVTVDNNEVNTFIQRDVDARSVSLNAYEKTVLKSLYDWSLDEYRSVVRSELLKRKVSFAVDTAARDKATQLLAQVQGGADIAAIAAEHSTDLTTKANRGDSGLVSVRGQDAQGLIAAAQGLEPGQLSGLISGTDGYYFIKLTSKDANNVRYSVVKVDLNAFDQQFAQLKKDNKIKEYISVDQETAQK